MCSLNRVTFSRIMNEQDPLKREKAFPSNYFRVMCALGYFRTNECCWDTCNAVWEESDEQHVDVPVCSCLEAFVWSSFCSGLSCWSCIISTRPLGGSSHFTFTRLPTRATNKYDTKYHQKSPSTTWVNYRLATDTFIERTFNTKQ